MASKDRYRKEFESFDWSKGLSRNDLMIMSAECPPDMLSVIPANRKFHSFEEFWSFFSPTPTSTSSQSGRTG